MIHRNAARDRHFAAQTARGLALGLVILMWGLGLLAGVARSAEMETVTPTTGPALILIKGELTVSDAIQFAKLTQDMEEATVFLQSSGGSLLAGLSMGKTIRSKGFITVVPPAASCISACALAWIGGTERFMAESSRIGFHAAYVMKGGRPRKHGAAEAVIVRYLKELQLPQQAISYLTGSRPESLYVLTMDQARDLGVEVKPYGADVMTGSFDAMSARAPNVIKRLPQVDLYGLNLPDMPIAVQSPDECEA